MKKVIFQNIGNKHLCSNLGFILFQAEDWMFLNNQEREKKKKGNIITFYMQKIESSWIIVNKKSWKKWVFEDASMKIKNYRLKQTCSEVASNRDGWGTKHSHIAT
jgi:hypothetical protein